MTESVRKEKVTTVKLADMKANKQRISMVTAYDFPTAKVAEAAGVDLILVGDSLGMVVLGHETTLPVTVEDMIHHTKAVKRGAKHTLVVTDMPFLSANVSIADTVRNAGRMIQEAGADAVKLEGGREMLEEIRALIRANIPVMGHLGLTPQAVNKLGGFKLQGRDLDGAKRIYEDALRLQEAGCFAIVLELVPMPLATLITEQLDIPTIGIGAGAGCDGQVLVMHDLLGITNDYMPRFVKKYANMYESMVDAVRSYTQDVRDGSFPGPSHEFGMKEEILAALKKELENR
ncbi:3-methyl-2-oxobutanoate hydroxymethyltransferase [Effusibacillus lacus]|uniref:3-methyl-2-oxobutanoate hydroxymethyltransferase n=1 Tax=Effusibacillus lacus TaxID=1348429 RepID=A0A292YMZ5_9BACL|nr:3-methyl-2-oxobutanoate hydroxymethyltransferase [Effusibacillus lacus]TCS75330.1 ketopantoate hydroxymethyltransferase [Effusibacillus lacus]GAX89764.1 3-methyl-2-oxobutanoate hydroxymethyltransferase [Effusibacillus lacus]